MGWRWTGGELWVGLFFGEVLFRELSVQKTIQTQRNEFKTPLGAISLLRGVASQRRYDDVFLYIVVTSQGFVQCV